MTSKDGFSVVAPINLTVPPLDGAEQAVLLRLVEAVYLVDEKDRVAPLLRFGDHMTHVLDPRADGTQGEERLVERVGDQVGQRGLAHAGRSPEDHRRQHAGLDHTSNDLPLPDQMLLPDERIERARTHALGERNVGGTEQRHATKLRAQGSCACYLRGQLQPVYRLLQPLLFRLPAERAHYLTMGALQTLTALPGGTAVAKSAWGSPPGRPVRCFGLDFPNPVGLAAGFDKDARWIDALATLGFGFLEVGTLTPRPQPGNPRPRLFRLRADRALINRMGFNNGGVEAAAERLARRRTQVPVGGNIGKNKTTPNEQAIDDYRIAFEKLHSVVDYFVVNVSSPNTPGLRELQEREPLTRLLEALRADNEATATPRPILLKIAPDLTEHQLDDIVGLVHDTGTAGLICTNTTIDRSSLQTPKQRVESIGAGGLSGDPVRARSTEVIRYVRSQAGPQLPIVGVGGIRTAADALEKLEAGANLVQVYTGFIYEGPAIVRNILTGLGDYQAPKA